MLFSAVLEKRLEQWQHSRYLSWVSLMPYIEQQDRKTIYEFMPLPGDPSKAEQERMKKEAQAAESKRWKDMLDDGMDVVKMLQNAAMKKGIKN